METKPERIPLEMHKTHRGGSEAAPAGDTNPPAPSDPNIPIDSQDMEEKIVAALQTCYDPEIPVNIYELGLIYGIEVSDSGEVQIRMTLTSPACPAALTLPPEVQAKVGAVPGVRSAKVEIVWDPPWTPERMSEAAKLQLGLF